MTSNGIFADDNSFSSAERPFTFSIHASHEPRIFAPAARRVSKVGTKLTFAGSCSKPWPACSNTVPPRAWEHRPSPQDSCLHEFQQSSVGPPNRREPANGFHLPCVEHTCNDEGLEEQEIASSENGADISGCSHWRSSSALRCSRLRRS